MLIKTMRPSKPIKDPYHYREFLTCLLIKTNPCYPSPVYGDTLSQNFVLKNWGETLRLAKNGKAPDNLFIYVHLPFCRCRCLYCQSRSIKVKDERKVLPAYLKKLHREMEVFSAALRGFKVTTAYFGGGTPSLLTPEETKEILGKLKNCFDFSSGSRIVFEASPYTLDFQKLDTLKELDIHELDLGIQSFDDQVLKKNFRPQKTAQAIKIIRYAKKIGIPSVACDLMVGMPHQSLASTFKTLALATLLPLDGIYINPFIPVVNSLFHRQGHRYAPENVVQRNQATIVADRFLRKAGYRLTPAGYRKHWTRKDQKHAYATQGMDNLLSFGHGAFSRAIGALRYHQALPGLPSRCSAGTRFSYSGLKMDLDKEMRVYAYTHIYDLSLKEFEKRFGKDFRKVFRKELAILSPRHGLSIQNGRIAFLNNDPVGHRVIKNFFIDKDYAERIAASSKEKYDARKDYRACIAPLAAQQTS